MRHGLVFSVIKKMIIVIGGLMLSQVLSAQLDDPTLPPNVTSMPAESTNQTIAWQLSSILISPQRSIAIINGQSVQVGDILAGARVKSINETVVKLKHRGETINLELLPILVKTVREN